MAEEVDGWLQRVGGHRRSSFAESRFRERNDWRASGSSWMDERGSKGWGIARTVDVGGDTSSRGGHSSEVARRQTQALAFLRSLIACSH